MTDVVQVIEVGGDGPAIHEAEMVATPARVAVVLPVTVEPFLRVAANNVAYTINTISAATGRVISDAAQEVAGQLLSANRNSGRLPMAGYDEATELFRRLLSRHRLRTADFDNATTAFCIALATNLQVAIGMGLA